MDRFASVLELGGFLMVLTAFWLVSPVLCLGFAGVGLVGVAQMLSRGGEQ